MNNLSNMSCDTTASRKKYGVTHFYHCGNKVKYKVQYINSIDGKLKTVFRCGMHAHAIKKNCERVKRLTGFDSELLIEDINQTALYGMQ